MSARTAQRNNVMAGSFLIISLILAVVLSFWVTDVTEYFRGGKWPYVVEFDLRDGSTGLEKGSPVYLGGLKVGKVKKVAWKSAENAPGERHLPSGIEVSIEIDDSVKLYSNAAVQIEKPILGGLAAVNIVHPGGPGFSEPADDGSGGQGLQHAPEPVLLARGGRMRGTLAPGLMAQAGLGPEQMRQIRDTLAKVHDAMSDIKVITEALAPNAEGSVRNVVETLADIRQTVAHVRSDYEQEWSPDVTRMLQSGTNFMANAEELSKKGLEISGKVDRGVDDLLETVDMVQAFIDANREPASEIVEHVNAVAAHFREQTTADIDTLMARAGSALGEFQQLGVDANALLRESRPEVQEILREVRLAALEGRVMVSEIRAQPWRVLRPPNTKESERQLLYASARSYADAVSDLKLASQTLESVLRDAEHGSIGDLSAADIARLHQNLNDAFQRFRRAEDDLLQMIVRYAPSE